MQGIRRIGPSGRAGGEARCPLEPRVQLAPVEVHFASRRMNVRIHHRLD